MKKTMSVLLLLLLFVTANLFSSGKKEIVEKDQAVTGNAKYVFLFIGDGMAMSQINSSEIYTYASSSSDIAVEKLSFTTFPAQGLTTTYDAGTFITDSASAATAIATGNKTLSGVVNMDVTKTIKFKTIAEYARDNGRKVGIISSVSLDHATPACFYAKVPSRKNLYDIALQLTDSNFDFFGGGGFCQPKGKDNDLRDIIEILKEKGYTYVNDPATFRALKPGASKIVAVNKVLQDSCAMPYEIDRAPDDLSLADYAKKAVELLDNPGGFFLMVEGGKIDWACHANDAAAAIGDTIAFDKAIGVALDFYENHPDETLIVVTGDHETGGMSIGFAGTQYSTFFDKVAKQKGSYVKFNTEILDPYKAAHSIENAQLTDLLPQVESFFGIHFNDLSDAEKELLERSFARSMKGEIERAKQEDVYLLYGGYEPFTVTLTHIVNQQAGIGWTTYSHTGVPVPTFAMGSGQSLFDGYYDNTDIYAKIVRLMGVSISMN
ncbi:MAG: alkaline phosphatase [Spirochaetales bacterium]|nr:alkaline phosphatase [Spirochaetales bacterium]